MFFNYLFETLPCSPPPVCCHCTLPRAPPLMCRPLHPLLQVFPCILSCSNALDLILVVCSWSSFDPVFHLLQVLAVSDIVVYRTRAERLHNDMFQFLSSASGAYLKHFTPELRALSSRCGLDVPLSSLGPAVIVFQETTHTQLLGHGRKPAGRRLASWGLCLIQISLSDSKAAGNADTLLQKRFHELGLGTEAFSSVQYVGTQTITPPTDYGGLLKAVRHQAENSHTRSPRQPAIVFQALEVRGGWSRAAFLWCCFSLNESPPSCSLGSE